MPLYTEEEYEVLDKQLRRIEETLNEIVGEDYPKYHYYCYGNRETVYDYFKEVMEKHFHVDVSNFW